MRAFSLPSVSGPQSRMLQETPAVQMVRAAGRVYCAAAGRQVNKQQPLSRAVVSEAAVLLGCGSSINSGADQPRRCCVRMISLIICSFPSAFVQGHQRKPNKEKRNLTLESFADP